MYLEGDHKATTPNTIIILFIRFYSQSTLVPSTLHAVPGCNCFFKKVTIRSNCRPITVGRWWGLWGFLLWNNHKKKHLVNVVYFPFTQNQQSLILLSSRLFPFLPGYFEAVTLRQHRSLSKRKRQEQDVQIISNLRGAVPRHVSLHSWVLTRGLRAGAGVTGPKSSHILFGERGKRTTTLQHLHSQ